MPRLFFLVLSTRVIALRISMRRLSASFFETSPFLSASRIFLSPRRYSSTVMPRLLFLDINSRFPPSLPKEKAIKEKTPANNISVLGIFITLIGASFSGWAQELAGQEKAGYWYAFTESDEELNRGLDGMYTNYAPEDSIKIEGIISEIEYFGLLDDCSETDSSNRELCEKYPVIHSDLGAIETKTYKTLRA